MSTKQSFQVMLDPDQFARLHNIQTVLGVPMDEVIRRVLDTYVEKTGLLHKIEEEIEQHGGGA